MRKPKQIFAKTYLLLPTILIAPSPLFGDDVGIDMELQRLSLTSAILNTTCEPFGEIGATAYVGLAAEQNRRNDNGAPLDEYQKSLFRPQFGDIVDEARIYYSAYIPDTISFRFFGRRWQWNHGADGITFGRKIYLNYSFTRGYEFLNPLIAHELKHVEQWRDRRSNDWQWAMDYFNDWCKAGFSYWDNKWEREARDAEWLFEDKTFSSR